MHKIAEHTTSRGNKLHLTKWLVLSLLLILTFAYTPAQRISPVGTWTAYLSHNKTKTIIRKGDRLYVNTEGGIYWYDLNTGERKTYSPIEGLTSVNPTAFFLDTLSGTFFLGYDDGSVDYFTDPDQEFNYITDIRRTDLFTTKRINDFDSRDNLVYIATEFGIVLFDIARGEVRSSVTKIGSNPTGQAVRQVEIIGDTIWVTMGTNGLWKADINVINLTVPGIWSPERGQNGLPSAGAAVLLDHLGERVYVEIGDTIFLKDPGESWEVGPFPRRPYHSMGHNGDNFFWLGFDNLLRIFRLDSGQSNLVHNVKFSAAYLDFDRNIVGDSLDGLLDWQDTDSFAVLTPEGPFNNLVTQMAVGNGELYIAPEGRNGTGPANNVDGFYSFNQERGWRRYNVDDELFRDSVWAEFARVHYDEKRNRAYLGSWNHGVLMVDENGDVAQVWTSKISGLSPSNNQGIGWNTRVTGVALDDNDVLWTTAILADFNLNVLTPDSVWHNINLPGTTPVDIIIDDFNNKWLMGNGNGITVFNENGTIDDTSDDQVKRISTDAGNGGLPNNSVYALVKDRRGQIWVGTLEGVVVYANPGAVFSNNFPDASCPVIDGFCLLRDQRINTIAVDGANRKWIGTNNGIYLVNPQGNRLLQHYTMDNSPIFSDEIRDIKIDPGTGEIFIGTSKGVLSLMGDATGGKDDSEQLYVFPNPIPYDFEGSVSISCSVTDAEVRITNIAGQLVRQLDALGGQAVWDFRDVAGQRLAPGIYLAMVADDEGQMAGIAKFVVLERNQ